MKLRDFPNDFQDLAAIVAAELHIPESAVRRDYDIVALLAKLADSPYGELCVFKGGTSLSKCYPGSIERFSEDIDLTYLGMEQTDKECDRAIKRIEEVMTLGAHTEKIAGERSKRSKSMYVWFDEPTERVKLEIGSSVRPDPYAAKEIKSYIHEYLERRGLMDAIQDYGLRPVTLNTLGIERTFVDKLMAVKRHAICGTLAQKVRHIYDVKQLYRLPEIRAFLHDDTELKRLLRLTKETDSYYLDKRGISEDYDPLGPYSFSDWESCLDGTVRSNYEKLHETLLFTDEKQELDEAIRVFGELSGRFKELGE